MTRIVHFIGDLAHGGIQRTLLRLVTAGAARHTIVTWRDRTEHHALRPLLPEAVHTWHVPRAGLRDPGWLWRVLSIVRQIEPELLMGWSNSPSAWALALGKAARIPVVTSEFTLREPPLRRQVHRLAAATVTDSDAVAATLPVRATVIRPGVPDAVDGPVASLSGRVILCIGALRPDKGQHHLVNLASRLDAQVVLVGPAADDDYCAALRANAPPNVRFEGALLDPTPWLRRADVLAVPSRTESCPNVILEARAYGLPVVAANVGDIARLLGDEDRLVDPSRGEDLLDALNSTGREAPWTGTGRPVPAEWSVGRLIAQYQQLWTRSAAAGTPR